MIFQQKYIEILDVVKDEIEQVLTELTNGVDVQEPLETTLLKFLNAPAKHIRPLVSFLYLKACGQNIDDKQILFQSAIELVHNASLIHDDVIDESLTRRGVKSLNSEFGNKMAVISGDYLLSCALNKILKIGKFELVQMMSDTLEIMSKGEVSQHFGKFNIPTLDEYIQKSEQKTAKLFETSLCGSLLIATQSKKRHCGQTKCDPQSQCFYDYAISHQVRNDEIKSGHKFARNFGIAFQIRDDLINCKTTQTDINDGIYTAPVIFAGGIDNLEIGIEKTQTLLNNYIDKAVSELKNIGENKYKTALVELLGLLKNG